MDAPPTAAGSLDRVVASLLPPSWQQSADTQTFQAGRAFVHITVVFLATDVLAALGLWAASPNRAAFALAAVTAILLAALLAAFRAGLRLRIAASLLNLIAAGGFITAITMTGGLQSPLAPWIPAIPLGALVTQTHRAAWNAFGVTALAVAGWIIAAHLGWFGPPTSASQSHVLGVALQSMLAILTLLLVSGARRVSRAELHLQRNREITARTLAEAESRAKTHVMASVSHEVRTPMTGILGLAELLAESV